MKTQLTHSEACERNKHPIGEKLTHHFESCNTVLEIGSGTGQHAVFFSEQMPYLSWQPSELPEHLHNLQARIDQNPLPNLKSPINIDVRNSHWSPHRYDAIFSANTLHIMAWPLVQSLFQGVMQHLKPNGLLCIYGPFRYQQAYTSQSNAEFDQWLQKRDAGSGIRDIEDLIALGKEHQLTLLHDYTMPANNQLLIWGNPS